MSNSSRQVTICLPEKMKKLFEPWRYKILYGGRGAGKSHSIAAALLVLGMRKPLRILCARELQNSIRDSVHKLLSDKIAEHGLEGFYSVDLTTIKGKNGTEFFFEGLKSNIDKVKSYEGIDIVWVEEAHLVTKRSWDTLIPTIRKENSEIWVSFNPELEDDETYQRFVANPPENAVVMKVNWQDNPWFPNVLRQEMEELKKRDPQAYRTVWEGECRKVVDGAIFAQEIEAAEKDGRVAAVPYDKAYPVTVSWDLGWGDFTSLWFTQQIGDEVKVIDFYQDRLKEISHYAAVLQERGYVYKEDLLPHDADKHDLGTGKTVREILRGLGRTCRVVPSLSKKEQIDAGRRLFSKSRFDAAKCREGLAALRRYKFLYDEQSGKFGREPVHDAASHASDSWMYMAVGLRPAPVSRNQGGSLLRKQIARSRHSAVVR